MPTTLWEITGHGQVIELDTSIVPAWNALRDNAVRWMQLPELDSVNLPAALERSQRWVANGISGDHYSWVGTGREVAVTDADGTLLAAVSFAGDSCPPLPGKRAASISIAVADEYRRRGLGRALVEELPAMLLDEIAVRHITAYDCGDNEPSLTLIQHAGWDEMAVYSDCYRRHPHDSVCEGTRLFCNGDHSSTPDLVAP
jgi:GNAT superfamily N-acetyltransferase